MPIEWHGEGKEENRKLSTDAGLKWRIHSTKEKQQQKKQQQKLKQMTMRKSNAECIIRPCQSFFLSFMRSLGVVVSVFGFGISHQDNQQTRKKAEQQRQIFFFLKKNFRVVIKLVTFAQNMNT